MYSSLSSADDNQNGGTFLGSFFSFLGKSFCPIQEEGKKYDSVDRPVAEVVVVQVDDIRRMRLGGRLRRNLCQGKEKFSLGFLLLHGIVQNNLLFH